MVRDHGVNLFYYASVERRKQGCGVRSAKLSLDCGPGSPGFGADTGDVWRHVRANDVPYNPLHDPWLPEHRLRAVHPSGAARRGPAGRPLVVGSAREQGVRPPSSRGGRNIILTISIENGYFGSP